MSRDSRSERSRVIFCALVESFQKSGSSTRLFSSSSRLMETSQSKMPPQQPDRLLDGLDHRFDFGAHIAEFLLISKERAAP